MMGLIPTLDMRPPEQIRPDDSNLQLGNSTDALGQMLQGKYDNWSKSRRPIEEDWLRDLRAFNQQNESDITKLNSYHGHIYPGITRTKCMSAFSRINDLMFGNSEKHWGIAPTPIPESDEETAADDPDFKAYLDAIHRKAELMETEIEDQMLDIGYEDHAKSAILESVILGTGVVKGVVPGVKTTQKWGRGEGIEWEMTVKEYPFPDISSPSIFNVIPDPYATRYEDLTGVFERHTKNRQQFAELKDDPKFDAKKIDEILARTDRGNHIPIYHETERRNIAGITDTTASGADRYDLLEYWGQVSGTLLRAAGVEDVEESGTYWANVWTCESFTLFARVMPMARQRIPYNFFIYTKVPHQFYGIGVARMVRNSQLCLNGSVRSMLDGMALAAIPMAEVNVNMLKHGQDPNKLLPGQIWLRDNGDPAVPAVRFFQPSVPTGNLMQMAEMFKQFADDETSLPAYTYGDQSQEINKTAQGMSMQMGAAAMPIKQVIKNLEDGCIKPLIESLYDWNMQWSDREEIKGDMEIKVLGSSSLIAKEVKSQRLLQFMGITMNPIDMRYVDRKWLLTEAAMAMDINIDKAIPKQPPEPPPSEPDPVEMARAQLMQAQAMLTQVQAERSKAEVDLTIAKTAGQNVRTQYEAVQTGVSVLSNTAVIPTADDLLKSGGYKDFNGYPIVDPAFVPPGYPQQGMEQDVRQNTSPQYPPVPQQIPDDGLHRNVPYMPPPGSVQGQGSPLTGIETMRDDGV